MRQGSDRRRRALLRFGELEFLALVADPGLRRLAPGRWALLTTSSEPDRTGRPGMRFGERQIIDTDGVATSRRVNLGESAVSWLSRRRGPDGRPWLNAQQLAAAERLRADFDQAGLIGRLTMDWSGSPCSGRGGPVLSPLEIGQDARRRVWAALEAVGPSGAAMLRAICCYGSALGAAERELRLPQRGGKLVLSDALNRLAAHYSR